MNSKIPDENLKIPGRLTSYDRDEIRAAHRAGIPVKQLAKEYRRKPATIRKILRPKGFTLVELLITLAIIGILATLIIAGIKGVMETSKKPIPMTIQPTFATWGKIEYDKQEIYYAIVEIQGREFIIFDKPGTSNVTALPLEPLPAEAPDDSRNTASYQQSGG